jgi:hypothetical protein
MSPPSRFAVNITPAVESKGHAGIAEFISKHELDTSLPPIYIKSNTRGDLALRVVSEYHGRWKELQKFFFMIGDYQSATLCDRDTCPTNPLPIKPESLSLYLDFKFGNRGTPLRQYGLENESQCDVLGQPILCQGEWHCPDNADKIRSAVHCLH